MNTQFKLKNPVVEDIMNKRLNEAASGGIAQTIQQSAIQGLSTAGQFLFSNPLISIIQNLLRGTPEETLNFAKASEQIINPEELTAPAPKMRYTTPPGLQLSRASTIA